MSSHRLPHIDIPRTDIWSALFERSDRDFPDHQVIYECPNTSRRYTYATVHSTASLFGAFLRQRWSWRKNDVLALFLQNCIDTPAVTWGCHWAGSIVSPANPAYTVRELAHHLKDSGAKGLVTQKALFEVAWKAAQEAGIPREKVLVVREEGLGSLLEGVDAKKEKREKVDAEDLAFLVYSSGTTGLPKGVELTHLNVVSNLYMINSSEGSFLSWKKDKILAVLPYYHIYGLQCLVHLPVFSGISTIVMPAFNLEAFCTIIQDHKITYTYVAPPILVHLAKNPIISSYDLSSLKTITSGAAPLAKELIHAVRDRLGTSVKQAYGLSETSPATHMQRKWDDGIGSNGPALPNQIVKIVAVDGSEVPDGTEGEIWVKGPNVFRGYHNNPEATKNSITEDGFFKTGDIGLVDKRGNMYITDRVKELIKYKGFQVAPAELEGLLMGCESVDDVAVLGIYDERIASEVPLAFVVPKKGVDGTEEKGKEIVRWLDEKVSAHKRLRGGVRFVDEIPKSASGKILRRVLKDILKKEGEVKSKL